MPAIGRPTDYKPEYCEEVVEFMGRGLSKEAYAGHLGISKVTLYNWIDKFPEFMNAVKRAEEKCRLFWEELGLVGTTEGKNFNATTWIFNMKNRFRWTDRQDITSDDKAMPNPILGGNVPVNNGNQETPEAN